MVWVVHRTVDNVNLGSIPAKAGEEPGQLGLTRKKLLAFLENSPHYTPEKMLSQFPLEGPSCSQRHCLTDSLQDLYEERAILLSKIGQHEQALSVFAHKLRNSALAEEWVVRV